MFNYKNVIFFLLILSYSSTPLIAKTIQRKAYKVCQAHEEAYWTGSSAECCNTSQGKYTLVKNYVNGVGESGYACCQIKESYDNSWSDEYYTYLQSGSNYSVVGAINGSCCGGYTLTSSGRQGIEEAHTTHSYAIRYNQTYYCSSDLTTTGPNIDMDPGSSNMIYESDNKVCWYNKPSGLLGCKCSTNGDPKNGYDC